MSGVERAPGQWSRPDIVRASGWLWAMEAAPDEVRFEGNLLRAAQTGEPRQKPTHYT